MSNLVLNKKAILDRTINTTVGAYRISIAYRRDMKAQGRYVGINPYEKRTRRVIRELIKALDD